jgi:hypothetical protein
VHPPGEKRNRLGFVMEWLTNNKMNHLFCDTPSLVSWIYSPLPWPFPIFELVFGFTEGIVAAVTVFKAIFVVIPNQLERIDHLAFSGIGAALAPIVSILQLVIKPSSMKAQSSTSLEPSSSKHFSSS